MSHPPNNPVRLSRAQRARINRHLSNHMSSRPPRRYSTALGAAAVCLTLAAGAAAAATLIAEHPSSTGTTLRVAKPEAVSQRELAHPGSFGPEVDIAAGAALPPGTGTPVDAASPPLSKGLVLPFPDDTVTPIDAVLAPDLSAGSSPNAPVGFAPLFMGRYRYRDVEIDVNVVRPTAAASERGLVLGTRTIEVKDADGIVRGAYFAAGVDRINLPTEGVVLSFGLPGDRSRGSSSDAARDGSQRRENLTAAFIGHVRLLARDP